MKPLLTVLTLLTSSTCIWADPIDPEKAREIAQAYMCGNQIPETVETLVNKRNSTDGYAPLYIFNRGNHQGFVIISGDDCMPYVLGYTEQGDFDRAHHQLHGQGLLSRPPCSTGWKDTAR